MWPRLKTVLRQSGWWGIAFLALGALDLALRLAGNSNFLLRLVVYLAGAGVAIRLLRASSRTLLWRLRNRLIVAYLFMAVVPVLLLVCLVLVGGWAVVGQVAVHMVDSELERRGAGLHSLAQLVARADPAARQEVVRQSAPFVRNLFPDAEMVIRAPEIMHLPEGSTLMPPPDGWKDASGLVIRDGQVYSWAHAVVQNVDVTIAAELTPEALAQLVPGLGDVFFPIISSDQPAPTARRTAGKRRRRSNLPPPYFFADVDFPWVAPKNIPEWNDPNRAEKAGLGLRTRASAVLGIVFGREMDSASQWVLGVFYFVAAILVGVEFYSLVMGIALTRTMTKAVQSLYEGTEHVKTGDFAHRIEVAGTDQLAELGQSFNGMTENLRRLILVEKEQERLQSELAIAREVQGQLFPKQAPLMRTLELAGVCNPARSVSGDYYDFIPLADGAVALAIGDVAGKGISAALLMASIQSIMRTQLTVGIPTVIQMGVGGAPTQAYPVAQMMATLNRQLYANTAPEKYATFCFGVYDESDRTFTYANAGHLPPILLRDDTVEILEVTGTVVGAFPHAQFEERTVRIGPGDLLATFTDGIVEPENEYGEAFGEERLLDLLRRYRDREIGEIVTRIMEAVQQWTGSSELSDDMTVLLARGLA